MKRTNTWAFFTHSFLFKNIVTYGRAALLVVRCNEEALLHLMVRKSYGQVSPSLFFEDVIMILSRER